jgi:hypothetical protein
VVGIVSPDRDDLARPRDRGEPPCLASAKESAALSGKIVRAPGADPLLDRSKRAARPLVTGGAELQESGGGPAEGGRAGWHIALDIALPRLKMVALKDFYWRKTEDGEWRMTMCPLGEGMVDWDRFFATIAKARFTGPLSLHVEYNPADEAKAIASDLAFMQKMVTRHYA